MPKGIPNKKPRRSRSPKVSTLRPTDKWIVGMVDTTATCRNSSEPEYLALKMFQNPQVFSSYAAAVAEAESKYRQHGKPFVVFAKKCVIGPSRPPVIKTEFSA